MSQDLEKAIKALDAAISNNQLPDSTHYFYRSLLDLYSFDHDLSKPTVSALEHEILQQASSL